MNEPRLGVVFRPQLPPSRLREVVLAAEEADLDDLWLWEDCFLEGGLTAAAAALAWSERLRVGVGLMPVPLRNPALAAMEVATLAGLFPGRFVPGFGHGVLDWMAQVGARVPSPMTLLREYVVVVRELLHAGTVDVDGRFVYLERVALDWPPAQVPPVLIGARGPKTLRLAGEVADGAILDASATVDDVRHARRAIGAGRQLVVYVEPPEVGAAALVRATADAGADTIVLQSRDSDLDAARLVAVAVASRP